MSTVKTEKRTDPFKPVIRKKDMDRDMYNDIERMAKECVENPKEKVKDENVDYLLIISIIIWIIINGSASFFHFLLTKHKKLYTLQLIF